MIDTDKYENMTWKTPSDELDDAVENLLAEVKRLREGIERLLNEGSPDRIWVHNTDLRELIE